MSSSATSYSESPSPENVLAAAEAIGYYLKDRPYAIVGGAACALLGSERVTKDVDVVVPKGETKDTRNILENQPTHFDVEKRTRHTYYNSNPRVEVEILTPPSLFREAFDASTPVIVVRNANVLKPTLILNAKCNSILGRATKEKKQTDAVDIQFCLKWCYNNDSFPTAEEVPRADAEFVGWFTSEYGGMQDWENVGYNFETGTFP